MGKGRGIGAGKVFVLRSRRPPPPRAGAEGGGLRRRCAGSLWSPTAAGHRGTPPLPPHPAPFGAAAHGRRPVTASSSRRSETAAEVPATPQSPPAQSGAVCVVSARRRRSSDAGAASRPGAARISSCANAVKIAPGAVVCVESEIRGDVTIGPRTVIHPKARIIAEAGPIVIGEGNLIEEQALIINAYPDNITPDAEDPEPKPMIIGTNNVFEVGCYSQAMKMGDNNVIESKAYVGRNVILTSGCIIGACCNLNTYEVIPENTVIYGADCLRRAQTERPQPQTLQLDFLMKILPNYHHLKKTMKGSSTPVKN
ncbi:dynactin subunit 6 isoform X2 [Mustela putorius furo]|uniref:Dynactin subunit 6 n=1 Tax=Mustela putorius furo TaxID=9669 RepID=A0A8U0RI68_MUSPF|nr:dynactin subunit 6 isoform X2 [Mustela putorius furo]